MLLGLAWRLGAGAALGFAPLEHFFDASALFGGDQLGADLVLLGLAGRSGRRDLALLAAKLTPPAELLELSLAARGDGIWRDGPLARCLCRPGGQWPGRRDGAAAGCGLSRHLLLAIPHPVAGIAGFLLLLNLAPDP